MDRNQLSDHDLLIRLDEKLDNFLETHAEDKKNTAADIKALSGRLGELETKAATRLGATGVIGVLIGGAINWAVHYFSSKHS